MNTTALVTAILNVVGPAEAWTQVFERLAEICLSDARVEVDAQIEGGDRLIADAAWELWRDYVDHAPAASRALLDWWSSPRAAAGRAVLVLDALSARELGTFAAAAQARSIGIQAIRLLGAPIPTDTNAFSRALGLSQRSQLKGSGYPKQWQLASSGSLYTDVTSSEFGVLACEIPSATDVFIWHSWLDDIIHSTGDKPAAPKRIATVAKEVLAGDGFWELVNSLRRGRELVITSDHGYAVSQRFADLPDSLGEEMRKVFGAQRYGSIPSAPLEFADRRPSTVVSDGRAAVIGPWKWKVQGGFPHVTHGGLSLGEVCVPYVRLPAISR